MPSKRLSEKPVVVGTVYEPSAMQVFRVLAWPVTRHDHSSDGKPLPDVLGVERFDGRDALGSPRWQPVHDDAQRALVIASALFWKTAKGVELIDAATSPRE
jgi:hypothetical protein